MTSFRTLGLAAAPMALWLIPAAAQATDVTFAGQLPGGTDPLGGVYAVGSPFGFAQFSENAGLQSDDTQDVLFNPSGSGISKATSFTLAVTGSSAGVLSLDSGFGNFFQTFTSGSTLLSNWNATENAAGTSITYSAPTIADALLAGQRFGTTTTFSPLSATLPADFAYTITWSDAPIATPEPTAWALMIVGFAAVGGTMRRARKVQLRYA
jgi:hypothetical protein